MAIVPQLIVLQRYREVENLTGKTDLLRSTSYQQYVGYSPSYPRRNDAYFLDVVNFRVLFLLFPKIA